MGNTNGIRIRCVALRRIALDFCRKLCYTICKHKRLRNVSHEGAEYALRSGQCKLDI